MVVTGTFSSHTGNPVVDYFHGYVVKQMKLSLLNTKVIQLAGGLLSGKCRYLLMTESEDANKGHPCQKALILGRALPSMHTWMFARLEFTIAAQYYYYYRPANTHEIFAGSRKRTRGELLPAVFTFEVLIEGISTKGLWLRAWYMYI